MQIVNTQNKIYNNHRRTYLDKGDLKEGESFCRKCKGVGEIHNSPIFGICPQCVGRGIVDWITQAVERPPLMTGHSSSSSCSSQGLGMNGTSGAVSLYHKGVRILKTNSDGIKIFIPKQVTNYKRRKVV
jgi:hypothetical protein